jgi:RimJ/RimL family protein N-acetyltransferase
VFAKSTRLHGVSIVYKLAWLPIEGFVNIEIHTPRLRLRPYRVEDVDDLYRLWTNPEVRRYLWDDVIISREQAASVVRASIACFEIHGFGQWVYCPEAEDGW